MEQTCRNCEVSKSETDEKEIGAEQDLALKQPKITKKQDLIKKYTVYLLLYMDTATLNGWRPNHVNKAKTTAYCVPPSKTEMHSTQLTLALRSL